MSATSLYLAVTGSDCAAFTLVEENQTWQTWEMVSEIDTLLRVHLSKFLTKCVINFPFDHFLAPNKPGTSVGLFLGAFESLTSMESFFYIRPFVSLWSLRDTPFFWTKWPNIKVLYIDSGSDMEFGGNESNQLWRHLGKKESLETLILREPYSYVDYYVEWSGVNGSFNIGLKSGWGENTTQQSWGRHLNVFLVDSPNNPNRHEEKNEKLMSIQDVIQPGKFTFSIVHTVHTYSYSWRKLY